MSFLILENEDILGRKCFGVCIKPRISPFQLQCQDTGISRPFRISGIYLPHLSGYSLLFFGKKSGSKLAKKKLELLISKIQITTVDQEVVSNAINDNQVVVFEDGLGYYSAIAQGCEVIITEVLNDFYYSEVKVFDCKNFIRTYFWVMNSEGRLPLNLQRYSCNKAGSI